MRKNLLKHMKLGDEGWTVPWAMSVDENMLCYLNSEYDLLPHPGGTVSMKVRRTYEGYTVDLSRCDSSDREGWKPAPYRDDSWYALRVTEIIGQ